MKPLFLCVIGLWSFVTVAAASHDEVQSHPVPEPAHINDSQPGKTSGAGERASSATAGNWLSIQREGTQASLHEQQATAVERELSYQRFLESYTHPIPEFFDEKAGGEISR